MKTFQLKLTDDLHYKVKLKAFTNKVTMQEFINAVLESRVNRREKRGG